MDGRISQANGRLKNAQVGVQIEQRGNRLILRATLPPRPNSSKTEPFQQRITLGYHANPAGLKLAEQEARKIGALLDCGEFDWSVYVKTESRNNVQTIGDWIRRFEADYFTRRRRSPQSETTWKDDYIKVFKTLPSEAMLTIELLKEAIDRTEADSRTRRRFVDVCSRLAEFAGLEANFKPLRGSYSAASTEVREVPPDALIAQWFDRIPNPAWRWVFGMMAAYGIRNHEVFHLDFSKFPVLIVLDGTKTNFHRVYPLYPEWAKDWGLQKMQIPNCNGRNNSELGNRVTHAFKRYGIPFSPYDLRHGWAIRSLEFGMPIELAAQQMGHSIGVHTQTYHRWISEEVHQRAYEVMMSRGDRPLPPC